MNKFPTSTPIHIAVIMDGNRRWAAEKHLPALAGHKKVTDDILEPLIEYASTRGIKYMTFWAWSTENWHRDKYEVQGIMKLFKHVIKRRWQRLHEKGVRVKIIGDISQFDTEIKDGLTTLIEKTKANQKITVIFALNYGGRDEIVRAINQVISDKKQVTSNENFQKPVTSYEFLVTENEFANHLDTAQIPDPEIIVRPGKEKRLSGFMLWQCAYSELYFVDWYMPDFTPQKLDEILTDFSQRQRRFGR